jgi:hypothetical protein
VIGVVDLGRALRRAGVPVSTPEIVDAARAAAAVDLGDREQLRVALRATLVKRSEHRPLFDELFEALASPVGGAGAGLAGELAAALGDPELAAAVAAAAEAIAATLPAALAAAAGAGPPDLAGVLRATGAAAELDGLRSRLQLGYLRYRLEAAAGLAPDDDSIESFAARAAAEAGAGEDAAAALAAVVRRRLAELRDQLRPHLERELALRRPREREALARAALADRALAGLSPPEIAELELEVNRLARRLMARIRRRRRHRQGRLDAARTLRRSLATDAVPFEIHRRRRRPRKPHVVVLCDISDSVRNVSRFMLQLVYKLAELFERVQAFAFVAELGELTELFRDHRVERAVELASAGAAVNVFANSDYGRVLAEFRRRHLGAVSRRTTVIAIGDGRSNYHDPGLEHLAAIRRRAGRLLWINPEPRSAWGFGDSAMLEYEPLCDQVAVAGNLRGLRRVIDQLIAI